MLAKQLITLSKHTVKNVLSPEQSVPSSRPSPSYNSNFLKGIVKLSKMMGDGRQQIAGLQFALDFLNLKTSSVSSLCVNSMRRGNGF